MKNIQGVCKDCGTGTMNNEINPAFDVNDADDVACRGCGSDHVDVVEIDSHAPLGWRELNERLMAR